MALRICFATSEMAPFAKTGGLADVSGALLKFLHADGHDIRLIMPAYGSIARHELDSYPLETLQNVPLQLGTYDYEFSVRHARVPGSRASAYLIECPAVYERSSLYTTDADEHRRFLLLTHAAFLCCQRLGFAPQIMHFNDWHTAAGALLLRSTYAWDRLFQQTRSVLTVHNIAFQGVIDAGALPELLPGGASMLDQEDLSAGRINLLRTGLAHADLITTVSPTYAREIQSPEFGEGLDALLRARDEDLLGILNGVDYDEWDPRHDRFLPRHFTPHQLGIKAELKQQLLQRLGLGGAPAVALIGIVSRLTTQKGFDLLVQALPPLLDSRACSLAVLGSGDARFEEFFQDLQRRYAGRVHFHRGYSDELAHWIEAGSDMFLMPSRYEPCGLNQMYSLRYGTVPIVRRTGGLADSVQHFDAASGRGTGIVFNDYDVAGVSWALHTALDLYPVKGLWRALMHNGMAQDFSWRRQAQYYVQAYERLLLRR
jgi:starch synthase